MDRHSPPGPLIGLEVELFNYALIEYWCSAGGQQAIAVGYFLYFPVDEPLRVSLSGVAGFRMGAVYSYMAFLTLGIDYEMDWLYIGADFSGGLEAADAIQPFYMIQIKAGIQYHF